MNVNITGRNFDITESIKDYAEGKLKKFAKMLVHECDAMVVLTVEKYRHKAEVLIKSNGVLIQAESITAEMYSSIDEVLEKLERQIKKYKDKLTSKRKTLAKGSASHTEQTENVLAESNPIRIIKRKRFDMKPMPPDEAAMNLELLDKDFYVFSNEITGDVNVIYRRKDGDFGLIEPTR
ncbi:MAG: ribosome-associated translation inhibitor RaiA [Nitrospirae bacterium]|nr:ribosome-associated translation inhibitor RaiA [Nitrospirota bacterium]MBF0533401.1 ribosome-associated translation inhibitor RaiA [Nitrospirota bacterium]MBF0616073.1 ribosome-associated translation inhibitor RaiA [Nitrospirota bacterium]